MSLVSAEGNFTDLQTEITEAGDVLVLNQNYTYNTSTDSDYSSGVVIDKNNFVLDGNGSTVNGNNQARIFNITGTNVTIKNLILINGNAANGGAIYINNNNGNILNVYDSIFYNNTATEDGGAIYSGTISGSTMNINNSTLYNNTAKILGGAIYSESRNDSITVNINNSTLYNNTAATGGAIYSWNRDSMNSNIIVNVNHSTLNNNNAHNGGAIYSYSYSTAPDLSSFTSISSIIVNVNNSTFNNNNASEGGAIFSYSYSYGYSQNSISISIVNVNNSILYNNTAEILGGAIYSNSIADMSSSIMNVNNSTLYNNTANNGGAIYSYSNNGNSTVNINNSTLYNNNATYNGGAIYSYSSNRVSTVNINNSTFYNNTANNGGAINSIGAMSSTVNINNSKLYNNNAEFGGAIYSSDYYMWSNVNINNSTLYNNNAEFGGTVYIDRKGNVYIDNSIFIDNRAKSNGGVIYVENGNLNVTYSVIYNNTANNTNESFYILYSGVAYLSGNFWGTNKPSFNNLINGSYVLDYYFTVDFNVTCPLFVGEDILINIYQNGTNNNSGSQYLPDFMLQVYDNENKIGDFSSKNPNLSIDTAGDYNLTLNYDDTVVLDNITCKVVKYDVNLNASNIVMIYRDGTQYIVRLTDSNGKGLANQTIIITVNGVPYTKLTNDTGYAFLNINLYPEVYNITSFFNETKLYNNKSITTSLTVKMRNITINLDNNYTFDYNETPSINGTINGLLTDNVMDITLIIDKWNTTISTNGSFTFNNIPSLNTGNYTIKVVFNGNQLYNPNSTNSILNIINTRDVILEADNIEMIYRDGTKYIVRLTDSNGNPLANQTISITVNGKPYYKNTNSTGYAFLNLNLNPGEYNITSYFNGTEDYDNKSLTTNLIIDSTIIGSDLTKYYLNDSQFTVKVLGDYEDKNVTFNVNGVLYDKTIINGSAT
ncbi:hypothetical protein LJB96_05475, partial [Methanobrevibacter sp. OttesenSCG-928-K11]|nr:hypothetical protein [Methanobrevibacter sp. OttesenSCG-928-K11]